MPEKQANSASLALPLNFLFSANQSARQCAGKLTIDHYLGACDERVAVAFSALDHAAASGGQIVNQFRQRHAQCFEINQVEIGAIARRDHAAIVKAVGPSRIQRLFFYQIFQR